MRKFIWGGFAVLCSIPLALWALPSGRDPISVEMDRLVSVLTEIKEAITAPAEDPILAAQVAVNTANILTNTNDILNNTNGINANSSQISTNTANILTNTNDILNNTNGISTNTSNIATNTSQISANTTNIAALAVSRKHAWITWIGDMAGLAPGIKTFSKNLSTSLPSDARIVGREINVVLPWIGGGATSVIVQLGISGELDSITSGDSIMSSTGWPKAGTQGIHGYSYASYSSKQLKITITADIDLRDLTGGSLEATVWYQIVE